LGVDSSLQTRPGAYQPEWQEIDSGRRSDKKGNDEKRMDMRREARKLRLFETSNHRGFIALHFRAGPGTRSTFLHFVLSNKFRK
jgi:hypothetical protein